MQGQLPVVTFDLFSALIDARSGGATALGGIGAARGWPRTGHEVYDEWDRRNKAAQRACTRWVPYATLAREALARTYAALGLEGDARDDLERVLTSLPEWPLWEDVAETMPVLGERHRIGLLSNVDDHLFRRTVAARYIEPGLVLTSERLRAYKPDPRIYLRARAALGPMVHVATSARDVRGALEAGVPVVRLRRPGHHLDPGGPTPRLVADGLADVPALVERSRCGG
ncbi:2-haloalkanoic acid dehalogenase type II [Saccharomonospora amisosensis]|uniref:2-haloalkanoic acid dehalogenase type II n=1 Tax=Saccharomonospora amisosensis TaxID=1128677 RepID=A0A7X5URL8_9PSEU|nr:HAD family hydrolase [Saccharomonospora amisosensis]NIJ12607.1 2-haloalkanoic acid dehalogenase type II [Saccharomonospora amisosensis]